MVGQRCYERSLSLYVILSCTISLVCNALIISKPSAFASHKLSTTYTTTCLSSIVDESMDLSQIEIPENTDEEKEFFARTAQLCKERNLPLQKVKNARDLSSVRNSPVKPGRVYRIGRVSDATTDDLKILFDDIALLTVFPICLLFLFCFVFNIYLLIFSICCSMLWSSSVLFLFLIMYISIIIKIPPFEYHWART